MQLLKFLIYMNFIVVAVMTAAYLYQAVYTLVGLLFRKVKPEKEAGKLCRFAALICARDEENVIAELIRSLKAQNYPAELLDVYVLADNCTDATARVATSAGAHVYIRRNEAQIGKGYALDYLLAQIKRDSGEHAYDGYFVFDADNLVDENFVAEMNKTFDRGYAAVTCYRNSKNFGDNWITASYSIWFLREARFLNYPRMLFGNSCAVSGTGFLISAQVIDENGGWPFHLLTEDIQFSVDCAVKGRKIGYCDRAIVYDEQPTSFVQSWKQRLRWSKGFFQVDAHYLLPLLRGCFKNKGSRMACFDMFMTVAPCMFLTLAVLLINLIICVVFFTQPHFVAYLIVRQALRYAAFGVVNYYFGMLLYGALTVFCEWKRIRATTAQKLQYLVMFPVFMASYIPVTLAALRRNVGWTHIEHYSTTQLAVPASGRKD
ncbi:MAG: glycosyltransferase family 2 protein [Oscillospiraceae bacterium]